jgi:hypothetical protein
MGNESWVGKRVKRSGIIPSLIDGIFGGGDDVNKETVDQIKDNVQKLQDQSEIQKDQITEAFKNINLTRATVHEHTKRLNDLDVRMVQVTAELASVKSLVIRALMQVFTMNSAQGRSARVQFGIVSVAMDLEQVFRVISTMATRKVDPTVIPPVRLRSVLLQISNGLEEGRHLTLPVNPLTHIWDYYPTMAITPVVMTNRLLILLSIPLSDKNLELDVYRVHNLPSLHVAMNISFTYDVEGTYLAITKDQEYMAIPTEAEVLMCLVAGGTKCTINTALYPTQRNRFCLYALYRQNIPSH